VVVAVLPPDRLEFVLQAKPRIVEEAFPSAVIEPFNVAPVVEVAVAGEVVTVGKVMMVFETVTVIVDVA
jgi:hypothetical protein